MKHALVASHSNHPERSRLNMESTPIHSHVQPSQYSKPRYPLREREFMRERIGRRSRADFKEETEEGIEGSISTSMYAQSYVGS